MTTAERLIVFTLLFSVWWNATAARYAAEEAHKHTHELGCALNYEPLCVWHGNEERH